MRPAIYFPGLNSLRFYAALSVVIQHLSSYTVWANEPASRRGINFLFMQGGDAVGLFFVLSGFLITYLLLHEAAHSDVDVGRFYARRVLRIWPPYFVAIAVGFALVLLLRPALLDLRALPLLLLMLPNVAYALNTIPHLLGPLWSIGVEEQAYLVLPWLVKRLLRWLPLVFVTVIVARVVLAYLALASGDRALNEFVGTIRFECMALGGLGAYALFYERRALVWIHHPILRRFAYAIFLLNIPFPLAYGVPASGAPLLGLLLAGVYLVVIMNVPRMRWLEQPVFNRLGTVSYGIYVYHTLVIFAVLRAFDVTNTPINDVVYYPAVIGLTLAVAFASYRWLETPFLRRKPQPRLQIAMPSPTSLS